MMLRLLSILLPIILLSTLSFGQEDDVPQEFLVKAKYLLNIPAFTEMQTQLASGQSYTICLIGTTPMKSVLESFKGKLINSRPLNVRRIDDISQAGNCQMLFIASSERHRVMTLLSEAHRRGILSISDMRDFVRMGGMVNLISVNNRITFDVNLGTAHASGISFSSRFLKLANDIIK